MASRYTQEYFFQHTLMNVSFTDLNEIIHPNAEDIPGYIGHYASAMFVNDSFWNDSNKVLEELKMERHRQDYIDSYMLCRNAKDNMPISYERQVIFATLFTKIDIFSTYITSFSKNFVTL